MQFKLGDFVRFVDENIEGYITRIIDKDTIGVTDSNDFEIPVQATKVTLVHGEIPDNDVVSNRPAVVVPEAQFIKEGIYLCLITDQHSSSVAHFHLVNESSFQLLASLTTEKGDHYKGEFAAIVPAHSTKKIYSAQLGDIQIWPKFKLEILFHTPANVEPKDAIIYHERIKGKDLSVAKEEIALLKQKGWLIRLDAAEALIDADKLKESFFKAR
ncbi:hypothetical protein SAMN05421820_11294 [Pedobacter steynii]|uniref:Uncharacterized protein n=1 Tax=Pedobacter steynii TaxID=430522 RepID=A0A1H0HBF4_9SPHI|nr:hypothetical protein [Pedobacter steynii]NQX42666.1 hypothetical protein [Pedobacter steynii]SDO16433.1 hypothetical protein SAMN05421820_11294 [Pedobacter steynii]